MTAVLAAIIPIMVILLLGKVIASTKILSDEGWRGLESITYYVLFPALIVSKLAVADFTQVDWRMPAVLIGAQLVLAIVSIALGKALNQPRDRIGVFVQSGVRWNTFIALAIAQDLMGATGLALVAAAAAAMIPTANTLSILGLLRFSSVETDSTHLLRQILVNPLIIACAVGLAINQIGIELHQSVLDVLNILAEATITVGLLATGSHIILKESSAPMSVVFGWSLLRVFGLPLAAGALAIALSMPPSILLVVLVATAVPTASNGAILARQLGGDARLAANLIACQTVFALVSVTAVLWVAEALNLI
ncbi:MAG: AEC family transporter [Pseudomonadota bacterium]